MHFLQTNFLHLGSNFSEGLLHVSIIKLIAVSIIKLMAEHQPNAKTLPKPMRHSQEIMQSCAEASILIKGLTLSGRILGMVMLTRCVAGGVGPIDSVPLSRAIPPWGSAGHPWIPTQRATRNDNHFIHMMVVLLMSRHYKVFNTQLGLDQLRCRKYEYHESCSIRRVDSHLEIYSRALPPQFHNLYDLYPEVICWHRLRQQTLGQIAI